MEVVVVVGMDSGWRCNVVGLVVVVVGEEEAPGPSRLRVMVLGEGVDGTTTPDTGVAVGVGLLLPLALVVAVGCGRRPDEEDRETGECIISEGWDVGSDSGFEAGTSMGSVVFTTVSWSPRRLLTCGAPTPVYD